jgi:hypothetical protein
MNFGIRIGKSQLRFLWCEFDKRIFMQFNYKEKCLIQRLNGLSLRHQYNNHTL